MADVDSTPQKRAKSGGSCMQGQKTPQKVVAIILSITCTVFGFIAIACAAITISELDLPDLSPAGIYREELEAIVTHTKVACAFLFIIAAATIVTRILVIIITTLIYGKFGNAVLIIDIISGAICAAVFFAVSFPMAVYYGQWIATKKVVVVLTNTVNGDPSVSIDYFNLNEIIPAIGSTAVFGFFTTFCLTAAVFSAVLAKCMFRKG